MKQNVKNSELKLENKIAVIWRPDDWDDGVLVEARKIGQDKEKPVVKGGFITRNPTGGRLFSARIGSEESCCGFPVMEDLLSYKEANTLVKEIGEALNEKLKENVIYMSAYVPDNKAYETTKKILKAAGFEPGVQLRANYGKYTNTRWEWFTEHSRPAK